MLLHIAPRAVAETRDRHILRPIVLKQTAHINDNDTVVVLFLWLDCETEQVRKREVVAGFGFKRTTEKQDSFVFAGKRFKISSQGPDS